MANANASTGLAALAAVVEHLHAEELATAHAEVVAARAEVVAARAEAARNNAMLVAAEARARLWENRFADEVQAHDNAEDRARWWEARTLATLRHFIVGGDEADISTE